MNQVYGYIEYSKQSFHQKMNRELKDKERESLLLPIIAQLRKEHPGVAARELYVILKPQGIGRDKFEGLCFENGYKISHKKSFTRTTDSTGVIRFPNLVVGRELTDINQVWSSDITYYQSAESCYYLTFIIDQYSRRIVGYCASDRLLTEHTTIPALKMALQDRRPSPNLIFHSDGGGQYYCKAFLAITIKHKIKNSMCEVAYENPFAERVNGTIKNQYLKGYAPKTLKDLKAMTRRAVYNYNYVKPHSSLKKLSPVAFENSRPAGGSSPLLDDFYNDSNSDQLYQKNHQSMARSSVKKTVNVF